MPYIISFTKWPSDKASEVIKIAIEVAQKYPPDDSLGEPVVPNAVKGSLEGLRTLSVTEVKEGKLEEALTRAMEILAMYGTQIEGFEYSIEVWATLAEAYASIGKTPP